MACALVATSCGGDRPLATSSTCGDFNGATTAVQLSFMRSAFGPHQQNRDLDARQVTEAYAVMANNCSTDPSERLTVVPFDTRLAP